MEKKYVYLFNEGDANMRNLLGGKGANLAEMSKLGMPVPNGFTITTEACNKYYEDDEVINDEIKAQIMEYLAKLEEETGKKFGDAENPLLVSVRSGARASMPGMMDTILNLGINDVVAETTAEKSGNPRFAYDSYRRFIQMFADVVKGLSKKRFEEIIDELKAERGIKDDLELTADDMKTLVERFKEFYRTGLGEDFPTDPKQQMMEAIEAVFRSWNNDRAIYYRRMNDIPGDWGTAVNVQMMVFGNMGEDCGTGVAFTRNPAAIDSWTNTIGGHTFRYPVIGICVDRDGSLWIATDGEGLAVYDPQADKTRIVTDGMGIDSNSILNVTADLQGRIWFSTERSVYCYDTAKNAVMCLNDLIPMSPEAFTQCSSTLLSDGDVMFGSIDGAVKCTGPDNLSLSFSPQPVFTDFEMMNTLLRPGAGNDIITRNIDDTEKITLAHDQNSFSISYSAVNMAYPRRIRFEHMLENFDKEWISADLPGWVKYTNLSPGNYKFRVRAIDRWTGSITGEREIDVAIRRSPWLSGWALLIYAAVAAGIIYILLQNFRHRINERRFNDRFRTVVSLAHDIKTPVSLIKAPLSEVLESNQLSDANRHNILLASQNADKLHSIITQLMEIQRSDEGDKPTARFAMCDIAKHLSGKIEEYRMLASQKGIGMEFDTHIQDFPTPQPPNSPTPISVLTDTEKLDHIIDNLLTNAVKYTARGSVTATLSISPRQWSVEISDTGIGIPASEQKRIFTEHYRASNAVNSKESGSGIGLMIVHRLVQQLGGAISFKSTEGVGSTFTLVFPTRINVRPDTEPAPDKSAPDISSAEADDQTNTLLIAEDDADLNAYLVKAFSDEYKVVSVPDGGKAYSTAVEINPDLVLTDLRMPVMGGDELCRRLKSSIETSHIPVILVTALSEREDIINGLEAGANDYIVKPFDMTMLKLRVRNIINGRRKLRETLVSSSGEVPDNDFTGTLDREFLDKVKEILDREMANSEYSINDFCREVGMSRTSFYNKIKVLTGTSPNDYIRIVRLNRARDLLSTRQYNVSEVSFMVGFSDPKYFSVCFKKQFGTSPSKI